VLSRHSPRHFDAVALGRLETQAWASYYRHEWVKALRAFVGMIDQGFGLGPWLTLVAAWHVLRANQAWAPVPDNDPDAARASMRRFYRLVLAHSDLTFDPTRAAELEVAWWHLHRKRQRGDGAQDREVLTPANASRDELERALVDLYTHVYSAPRDEMREAARWRAEAMDLSDAWVAAGCDLADPQLAAERRALVASYSALLDAVSRVRA
jgi:hypothetical protein